MNPKAVVLLSGGLGSSTAAALAIADGFGMFESAKRFCQAFDEVRNVFRHNGRDYLAW